MKTGAGIVLACLAATACVCGQSVIARKDVSNDMNLNDGASWVSDTVPGDADIALFDRTMATPGWVQNPVGGDLWFKGIRVTDPQSFNVTYGYRIVPTFIPPPTFGYLGTIYLGSSGIDLSAAVAIQGQTGAFFSVDAPLQLTASQVWNVKRLSTNPHRDLSIGGSLHTTNFRRTIACDLAGFTVTKRGTGIAGFVFDRLVSNGRIRIEDGTVLFSNAQNAASNTNLIHDVPASLTVEVAGGRLNVARAPTDSDSGYGALNWNANVTLQGGALQLNGGGYTGNLALDGTLTAAAGTTSRILYDNTATISAALTPTLRMPLAGSGNVIVEMPSPRLQDRLVLSGNNSTHTGTLTISSGNVQVVNTLGRAAGTVVVNAGAVLSGTGRTGALTVKGSVRPGVADGDAAQLFAGSTQIQGRLVADVSGNAADVLDVTGTLDGGIIDMVLGSGGFTRTSYVVAKADAITGTWRVEQAGYVARIVASGARRHLTIVRAGYTEWAADWITAVNASAPAAFDADADRDGIRNGLEWMTGTLPMDAGSRPDISASRLPDGSLVLRFPRNPVTGASLAVDYSSSLSSPWTRNVTVGSASSGPDANGASVTVDSTTQPHRITVTLPAPQSGRLFARLRAVLTP